jgi:hypothetical protein
MITKTLFIYKKFLKYQQFIFIKKETNRPNNLRLTFIIFKFNVTSPSSQNEARLIFKF